MVPSLNLKHSYYGIEYTFLPNLVEIDGGEGVQINQNRSKIGRKYIENRGQKWGCFNGTYLRNH